MGAGPHQRNGFPGQHKLPEINRYSFHPSEQHMTPAADIEDQELAVCPECPSVYQPTVGRGSHLCASSGGNGKAFFDPTVAIRGTKFLQPYAVSWTWNSSTQGSEGDGWRQAS